MRLNKIQKIAVNALEDIKARDITVLDVRKLTSLYDTLIVASAESNRQVKALANNVRDKLKQAGAPIIGVEGEEGGEWVLVDAGDIVVHIMQPAVRAYYSLEELWTPPKPVRRAKPAADATAASGAKPRPAAKPKTGAAPGGTARAKPAAGAKPAGRAKPATAKPGGRS